MKPAAAWAFFASISLAITVYVVFSQRYSELPPDFAALELVRADFNDTGSCYSLHNVLVGNDLTAESHTGHILWTMRVKDEWHLRLSGDRGWREYWFVREGDRVRPMQYVVEDDKDGQPLQQVIDELLESPRMSAMPRLAHCGAAN